MELRIYYTANSEYKLFIDYFKSNNLAPKNVVLESLKILWEPYILSERDDLSSEEVQKLLNISYQKFLNHYQLMCLHVAASNKKAPDLQ